jgi:hypothetical protein
VNRVVLLFSLALIACQPKSQPAGDEPPRMSIAEALHTHTDSLMAIPGVVGVGEGRRAGAPAVQVLVVRRTPELERRLPKALEGFPVDVVETGVIEAQPKAP